MEDQIQHGRQGGGGITLRRRVLRLVPRVFSLPACPRQSPALTDARKTNTESLKVAAGGEYAISTDGQVRWPVGSRSTVQLAGRWQRVAIVIITGRAESAPYRATITTAAGDNVYR